MIKNKQFSPFKLYTNLFLSIVIYSLTGCYNPHTCPKIKVDKLTRLEINGIVEGYIIDCTKRIFLIYINGISNQGEDSLFVINLVDEYACLSNTININDTITKKQEVYSIVIKSGNNIKSFEPDCLMKCECLSRNETEKVPKNMKDYIAIF